MNDLARRVRGPAKNLYLNDIHRLAKLDALVTARRFRLACVQVLLRIKSLIEALAVGVEAAAAIVIGLAVLSVLVRVFPELFGLRGRNGHGAMTVILNARLRLGRWLALALELTLAADILRTAVAPTWDEIGKLAAIAALRTALNYFLEREIRHGAPSQGGAGA